MDTIGERLSILIRELDMTKTKFAEKIHVSQPFISNVCSGIKDPSDRTISDICREFHVSEAWLRYGEGEMFTRSNRNEEIASIFAETLSDKDESFRKRLISGFSALSLEEWEQIEKLCDKIIENMKNPGGL